MMYVCIILLLSLGRSSLRLAVARGRRVNCRRRSCRAPNPASTSAYLGATIVVAQALCLTIFNLPDAENLPFYRW